MKKKLIITSIALGLLTIIIIISVFVMMEENRKKTGSVVINDVNLDNIDDGTYYGTYSIFPVTVEVNVTVKDHEITDIDIIRHENGFGSKAEKITDDVIARQSLDVEFIEGATSSSKAILKAIEVALTNGN